MSIDPYQLYRSELTVWMPNNTSACLHTEAKINIDYSFVHSSFMHEPSSSRWWLGCNHLSSLTTNPDQRPRTIRALWVGWWRTHAMMEVHLKPVHNDRGDLNPMMFMKDQARLIRSRDAPHCAHARDNLMPERVAWIRKMWSSLNAEHMFIKKSSGEAVMKGKVVLA